MRGTRVIHVQKKTYDLIDLVCDVCAHVDISSLQVRNGPYRSFQRAENEEKKISLLLSTKYPSAYKFFDAQSF